MPSRNYQPATPYKYGFNGQEKDDEIFQGAMTAEYWEYDSRLGRRWNIDPIVKSWESPYLCFSGNPIYFADPSGLSSSTVTPKGGDNTYIPSSGISDNFKRVDYITYLDGDKGHSEESNHYNNSTPLMLRKNPGTFDSKMIEAAEQATYKALRNLKPNSMSYALKRALYSKTSDALHAVNDKMPLIDAGITLKDLSKGEVTLGLPLEDVAKRKIGDMEFLLLDVAFKNGQYKPFVRNLAGYNRVMKDNTLAGIVVTESELKERATGNSFNIHGIKERIKTDNFIENPGSNTSGETYKYFIVFPAANNMKSTTTINNFSLIQIQ